MCDHVQVCVVVCDYLSTVDVGWDGKITLKGDGWNPKKDHHRRKGFSDVACCDKPEPEYAKGLHEFAGLSESSRSYPMPMYLTETGRRA